MGSNRLRTASPLLVAAFGAALFLTAGVHHVTELASLGRSPGPVVAFLLDGPPALALAVAGYRLWGSDLAPGHRWRVSVWTFGGGLLFAAATAVTFAVRAFEGRPLAEPVFPLLIAVEAGALAGAVAGYYNARSRADAHRARTVSDALAFVNDLIRHDLRNDLQAIRGHAELLDSDDGTAGDPGVVAEKTREALTRIETTRAIANTLLGEPELEPVDLAAVVAEVATRVEATYRVTVTTDLPEAAPVLANDGLRSVVDNLVENAAEHNDADDPRVEVAVGTDGDRVRLTVRDNGPGLPDDLKRPLRDAGSHELDGGGLSLVRTLVEGYDGEMRVGDNDPRGSVFVVDLPRAEA